MIKSCIHKFHATKKTPHQIKFQDKHRNSKILYASIPGKKGKTKKDYLPQSKPVGF